MIQGFPLYTSPGNKRVNAPELVSVFSRYPQVLWRFVLCSSTGNQRVKAPELGSFLFSTQRYLQVLWGFPRLHSGTGNQRVKASDLVSLSFSRYLQVEWNTKMAEKEGKRDFTKENFKGFNPKCPQQNNFSDCGIYILQYVESFFKVRVLLSWGFIM